MPARSFVACGKSKSAMFCLVFCFTGESFIEFYPGVELLDFGKGHRRDGAGSIGGAIDRVVMDHDHGTVSSELNVEFAHLGAGFDRRAKGGKRIFGKAAARSAMGNVQHEILSTLHSAKLRDPGLTFSRIAAPTESVDNINDTTHRAGKTLDRLEPVVRSWEKVRIHLSRERPSQVYLRGLPGTSGGS